MLRDTTKEIQRIVNTQPDGVWGPITAAAVLRELRDDQTEQNTTDLDERTRKHLATLEPRAQRRFLPFIRHAKTIAHRFGVEYVAISGTRGRDEQNALYAKGRTAPGPIVTNAKFGYSNHNFGIALDFGVFRGGRYLDGSEPATAAKVHKAVAEVAPVYGIEWGGNWARFKDYPHFEIETDLTMTEKRARLFAGKPILD